MSERLTGTVKWSNSSIHYSAIQGRGLTNSFAGVRMPPVLREKGHPGCGE